MPAGDGRACEGASGMITVVPDQTLVDLCPAGCTIFIGDGERVYFQGDEQVVIENGRLLVDDPEE